MQGNAVKHSGTPEKILKTDQRLRTLTIISVVILLAAGVATIHYTQSFIAEMQLLAKQSPDEALQKVAFLFKALAVGSSLIPLGAGFYLLSVSQRVWRSGEFPPPGTRVIKDTRVIEGSPARHRAVLGFVLALILLMCGIMIPLMCHRLVENLLQRVGFPGNI